MIAELPRYPDYKDSGAPWLGDVPEHWEVLPNRAVFTEVNEREHPEEQMLSVTIAKGVIRQRALLADSSKKDSSRLDKSAYKLVRPGDIAYNKMRAWQGAIGVSDYQGIISPAYVVQRPHEGADSHYLHYLLRTPAFATEAERWSYGITSDMWSLRPEHFRMIYGCLPPLEEQGGIVRFLDYADRRIRRYIATRKKLIALLDEQKQAVIDQAVTRGLDPNIRLKPSGVQYLGAVPEHWSVRKVNQLTDPARPVMYGIVLPGPNVDEGVLIVKGGNCEPGRLRVELLSRTTFQIEAAYARSRLRRGDIVIAIRGGVGAAEMVPPDVDGANLTQDAARIAPRHGVHPGWLLYSVRAPKFLAQVQARVVGATVRGINIRDLKRIDVPVPPTNEQAAIAEYLGTTLTPIEVGRDRLSREISLVGEYRTRLVSDVVTGRLDVRDAAAQIPDELEELAPPDDLDVLAEGDSFEDEPDPEGAAEEATG